MCELITLHPFFELNGRTIRLFFDMIAIYNGYEYIDYYAALVIEEEDNKLIKASIDCMGGNGEEMLQIIRLPAEARFLSVDGSRTAFSLRLGGRVQKLVIPHIRITGIVLKKIHFDIFNFLEI